MLVYTYQLKRKCPVKLLLAKSYILYAKLKYLIIILNNAMKLMEKPRLWNNTFQ